MQDDAFLQFALLGFRPRQQKGDTRAVGTRAEALGLFASISYKSSILTLHRRSTSLPYALHASGSMLQKLQCFICSAGWHNASSDLVLCIIQPGAVKVMFNSPAESLCRHPVKICRSTPVSILHLCLLLCVG